MIYSTFILCSCVFASSGLAPARDPRVEDGVSDVIHPQQPCDEPLQTEAVATVWTRAILPLSRKGGERERD